MEMYSRQGSGFRRADASPNCPSYCRAFVLGRDHAACARASACVGDDDLRAFVRTRRFDDGRASRLDFRRHVLRFRHPGARAENKRPVHARRARPSRQGQCRVAAGICLLHVCEGKRKTAEGRSFRSGRLLSRIRSERDGADAAFHASVQDTGKGEGARRGSVRSRIFYRLRLRREGSGAARQCPGAMFGLGRKTARRLFLRCCPARQIHGVGSECRIGRKLRQPDIGKLPVRRDAKARLVLSIFVLAALAAGALCQDAAAQSSPLAAMRQPAAGGLFGWLLSKQALFYRELSGLIRAAKSDGTALWGLMGLSFAYGIFHAAGPGHGKAVISSYLVANEETWRRGVMLSFASAFLQALTAVVLVGVAAILIGATAKAMGDTVRVIETVSYALIVLVGARLLWVKGRAFLRTLRTLKSEPAPAVKQAHDHNARCTHHEHAYDHRAPHSHNDAHAHGHGADHNHAHDQDDWESVLPWDHAHGPEP